MRRFVGVLILGCSTWAWAQEKTVTVDFAKPAGTIRPLHDVHNGPVCLRGAVDLSPYFKELGIRFVRIHDAPQTYGPAVDVHFIFRDLSADPEDPKNYDFMETDRYVQSILDAGGEVVFRLGESVEMYDRKFNVPPADFAKWARVCVNIVRHYNDGWADGFKHGIRYWEVWNEPDIKNFWAGTVEQYCELYETTARAIKAHDAALKVGGPALAANRPFLEKFLGHCRDRKVPLDFVSWHSYGVSPWAVSFIAGDMRKAIDRYGFAAAESHLNEWSYFPGDWNKLRKEAEYTRDIFRRVQGMEGAAYAGGVLTFLQDAKVDVANYYRGTTLFWGLFDEFGVPYKNYYALRAFRSVLDTPKRVAATGSDQDSFAVLAGVSEDGKSASVMISNLRGPSGPYKIVFKNAPWEGAAACRVYVLDEKRNLEEVAVPAGDPLMVEAGKPSVCLVKINADLGKGGPLKRDGSVEPPVPAGK